LAPLANAQPARRHVAPACVPVTDLPAGGTLLDRVRMAARRARAGRQVTLREATRGLACPGVASGAAEALVRTLGEVLGRRPVFHGPGAPLASFDEAWLIACHDAQRRHDADSLAFLVRSRVAPPNRRAFLDLLRVL
jgi:hypothetical protein